MPEFTVNPNRLDPYENYKFRVMWDQRVVAGISRVSALRRTSDVEEHREAGDSSTIRKSPGLTKYDAITLERGVTHDHEFEEWANKVWDITANPGTEVSLKSFRKEVILELYNEAGQLVIAYKLHRCWPSEYIAISDLDSMTETVLIERLRLETEGWERDLAIVEPVQP